MKSLRDQVVVITGASSGLGRATAFELARRGCALTLAARDREALEDTARRCRTFGARALVVVADVTDETEVHRVADETLAEHGRIDVWVNNAGVTLYALLEDDTAEHHEAVIRTNLIGAMHGSRVVVPIFRKQHRGTLINVGSVLSHVGQAFVPSYVISKFGVRGLSEALRVELADEPDIHVCTLFPYAIDTPHFQSARNFIGKEPRAMPPVQSPDKVAVALRELIETPRRERFVPRVMRLGVLAHALLPRTTERLLLDALRRWHLSDAPVALDQGNLYEPKDLGKRQGDNPPMVSTPRFALWLVGRLVGLAAEGAARMVRG